MKWSRSVFADLLAASSITGCAITSRLAAGTAPTPSVAGPTLLPQGTPAVRAIPTPHRQLGLDLDFPKYAGLNVADSAKAGVATRQRHVGFFPVLHARAASQQGAHD